MSPKPLRVTYKQQSLESARLKKSLPQRRHITPSLSFTTVYTIPRTHRHTHTHSTFQTRARERERTNGHGAKRRVRAAVSSCHLAGALLSLYTAHPVFRHARVTVGGRISRAFVYYTERAAPPPHRIYIHVQIRTYTRVYA